MSNATFEEVKHMIEQMPPDEVERLRVWLNAPATKTHRGDSEDLTWGERLVALVSEFPVDAADEMVKDDPETWVREHRRTSTSRRNPGWGDQ